MSNIMPHKNADKLNIKQYSRCAVIVAHPDDEALWAGGTILMHPEADWTIITLCRESDPDRADRFYKACDIYGANGDMGDLDDGPDQTPLEDYEVQKTILDLLPSHHYDLILTHDLWGEYTRHVRHEEVSRAVMALRRTRRLHAVQVLRFAYEDGDGKHLPLPNEWADVVLRLNDTLWQKKRSIITDVYGFTPESWEARTTPRQEAYWEFGSL